MEKTKLESNQSYPVLYVKEWFSCFFCGGKGTVECDEEGYFGDVRCPECMGEKGKWKEVMV